MKIKDKQRALEHYNKMAQQLATEIATDPVIVIKYRINGAIFRRRYTLAQAHEARERIAIYERSGVEVVSVRGLPALH